MNFKQKISENPIAIFFKILPAQLKGIWQFAKNNARCYNSSSPSKALTDILMLSHALEKAFSLPSVRRCFGMKKAQTLCTKLTRYIQKNGMDEQLLVSLSVLKEYIKYHRENNSQLPEIEDLDIRFNNLIRSLNIDNCSLDRGGTYEVRGEDLIAFSQGNFESLVLNRYAIRNFSNKQVDDKLIRKALDLAKKSPSACNRQGYKVHLFKDEKKNEILKIQGGANSFYDQVDTLILVTADSNRYYLVEKELGYIDASLFSMTLIYALTYLGVGSIPLTLGIKKSFIEKIKDKFSIPSNEVPVLLIAVGNYPERLKVAKSYRKSLEEFVTVH